MYQDATKYQKWNLMQYFLYLEIIYAKLQDKKSKKSFQAKFFGKDGKKLDIHSEDEVKNILNDLEEAKYIVDEVKQGEKKRLLTIIMRRYSLLLIFLLDDGRASTVHNVFNRLEHRLGLDTFRALFPVILTALFDSKAPIPSTLSGIFSVINWALSPRIKDFSVASVKTNSSK